MKNGKYKLALVGATGLVGRTVLKVLEEKTCQFTNTYFLLLIGLLVKKLILWEMIMK